MISDSCSSSCTRRRVASYSRAFSIAPGHQRGASGSRSSASSSVSVRGARECRPITPNTAPSFAISGTDTIDWYFSSSNSGKYRARGSASASDGMKIGWRCSLTQPAKPSPGASVARPTASAYCDEAAAQHEPSAAVDDPDEARLRLHALDDQPHDRLEHLLQVDGGRHRADDLVEDPALVGRCERIDCELRRRLVHRHHGSMHPRSRSLEPVPTTDARRVLRDGRDQPPRGRPRGAALPARRRQRRGRRGRARPPC